MIICYQVQQIINGKKVIGDVYLNDFGFGFQVDWDYKNKKTFFRKNDNGNYIVGKIYNLDLAKNLKSGDAIISLNNKKNLLTAKSKMIF